MEIEAPPNTPELAAAEAEHEQVITNPTHQHYAGLRRGDKTASDYVDALYRKAVLNNKPIEIGKHNYMPIAIGKPEGLPTTTDLTDEARAGIDVETELRMELGDTYDTVMQEMAHGAQFLFEGQAGQQALTALSERISGLGPNAEALGVKFLADLSKLHTQGG